MRKTLLLTPALALLLLVDSGCSRQASPPSDQQLSSSVQSKLKAESALSGQDIQAAVNNGVVTLSGTAADPASRALAGNDAGSIPGVRTVVNNLTVLPPPQTASATSPVIPPAPQPSPAPEPHAAPRSHTRRDSHHDGSRHAEAYHAVRDQPPPPPADNNAIAALPPPQASTPPPTPPPPPQPVARTVTLQAGTVIPVRITDPLDSATAQPDDTFHATLAADLIRDGMIVAPRGTPVLGRIVDAKDATHFKGSSLLALELTSLDTHGRHISIVTDTFSQQGKARGKNTAEKAGGGALLGTLIGALAGGGKGAAIGAIAGAGAGTGINAATRGDQVKIPAETLLNFTLQQPLSLTTTRSVGSPAPANPQPDPSLEQRPQ